jgi:hypothetical protein
MDQSTDQVTSDLSVNNILNEKVVENAKLNNWQLEKDTGSENSEEKMNVSSINIFGIQEEELDWFNDTQILMNPSQNNQYKLVERPKYLLQFENHDIERDFNYQQFKFYMHYSKPILLASFLLNKVFILLQIWGDGVSFSSV